MASRGLDGIYRKKGIEGEILQKQEKFEGNYRKSNSNKTDSLEDAIRSIKALGLDKEIEEQIISSMISSFNQIGNSSLQETKNNELDVLAQLTNEIDSSKDRMFRKALSSLNEGDPEKKRHEREAEEANTPATPVKRVDEPKI